MSKICQMLPKPYANPNLNPIHRTRFQTTGNKKRSKVEGRKVSKFP